MLHSSTFHRSLWQYLLAFIAALLLVVGVASLPGAVSPAVADPESVVAEVMEQATAIAVGVSRSCALMSGGSVKCWGSNEYGQLGDGTATDGSIPVDVVGLSGAVALTAGGFHTCALMPGGTAKCWGSNASGQLGDGTADYRSSLVDVAGLSGAVALTAGYQSTCALMPGGTAKCWGSNARGQLGDGTATDGSIPVDVVGLSGAVALTAGGFHTCALMPGGTAKCWGSNEYGQMGGDDGTPDRLTPGDVNGLAGAADLTASFAATCALMPGGTAKCWGTNGSGLQLTPVDLNGLTGAVALAGGSVHTCALMPGGTVKCWGGNEVGQLGDGTTDYRSTPVYVIAKMATTPTTPTTPTTKNDARNVPPEMSGNSDWWSWPDRDGDGIPDFWETNGVWVNGTKLDLAQAGARTGQRDLFIYMDYEQGNKLDSKVFEHVRSAFANAPSALRTKVHFIDGTSIPSDIAYAIGWERKDGKDFAHLGPDLETAADGYGFADNGWAGDQTVPQLAKYFVNLHDRNTATETDKTTIGYAFVKGVGGWVAYNVPGFWSKAISLDWSDDATHFSEASNLLHEIGHTLGLNHYGGFACANWQDPNVGNNSNNKECNASARNYKSVMSYAYNVLGVPEAGSQNPRRTRMDYSRDQNPWLDWSTGPAAGYLTFVPGQHGERLDFYNRARGEGLDASLMETTVSEPSAEILNGLLPSTFDAFAEQYGISARPDFPRIDTQDHYFDVGSDPVTGKITASDNAGSNIELVIVEPPSHGTFTTTGLDFTYTPNAGYTGDDQVTVRATNQILSSEPLTLTFTVSKSPPVTTTPSPGTGSSTGSFGS